MAHSTRHWSPEEIQAMRHDLLENNKTLMQVAAEKGVSHQRIAQLTGKLDRNTSRSRFIQSRVAQLYKKGLSDEQIAAQLKRSVATVRQYRTEAGFRRSIPKKWTRKLLIQKAQEWYERYGYTPSTTDWSPAQARAYNQLERVERYYEFGAPSLKAVYGHFPSWSAFINETGLPPVPTGNASHGRWKMARRVA